MRVAYTTLINEMSKFIFELNTTEKSLNDINELFGLGISIKTPISLREINIIHERLQSTNLTQDISIRDLIEIEQLLTICTDLKRGVRVTQNIENTKNQFFIDVAGTIGFNIIHKNEFLEEEKFLIFNDNNKSMFESLFTKNVVIFANAEDDEVKKRTVPVVGMNKDDLTKFIENENLESFTKFGSFNFVMLQSDLSVESIKNLYAKQKKNINTILKTINKAWLKPEVPYRGYIHTKNPPMEGLSLEVNKFKIFTEFNPDVVVKNQDLLKITNIKLHNVVSSEWKQAILKIEDEEFLKLLNIVKSHTNFSIEHQQYNRLYGVAQIISLCKYLKPVTSWDKEENARGNWFVRYLTKMENNMKPVNSLEQSNIAKGINRFLALQIAVLMKAGGLDSDFNDGVYYIIQTLNKIKDTYPDLVDEFVKTHKRFELGKVSWNNAINIVVDESFAKVTINDSVLLKKLINVSDTYQVVFSPIIGMLNKSTEVFEDFSLIKKNDSMVFYITMNGALKKTDLNFKKDIMIEFTEKIIEAWEDLVKNQTSILKNKKIIEGFETYIKEIDLNSKLLLSEKENKIEKKNFNKLKI